jgi:hypothetical protein
VNSNGKPTVDKSMVCCVYVCNIWKAAGVFRDINNDFNCAEMSMLYHILHIFSMPSLCHCDVICSYHHCCVHGYVTANWDDYSLNIFDTVTARPSQCISADPSNTNCQLEGKYTLVLNNYASHKVTIPYISHHIILSIIFINIIIH